jgi:hypothetical protein
MSIWPRLGYDINGRNRTIDGLLPYNATYIQDFYTYKDPSYATVQGAASSVIVNGDISYVAYYSESIGKVIAIRTILSETTPRYNILWEYTGTWADGQYVYISLSGNKLYVIGTTISYIDILNISDGSLYNNVRMGPIAGPRNTNASVFIGPDGNPCVVSLGGDTVVAITKIADPEEMISESSSSSFVYDPIIWNAAITAGGPFWTWYCSTPIVPFVSGCYMVWDTAHNVLYYTASMHGQSSGCDVICGDKIQVTLGSLNYSTGSGIASKNIIARCSSATPAVGEYYPSGMIFNPYVQILYVVGTDGLHSYDKTTLTEISHHDCSPNVCYGGACLNNSRIYYRAGTTLYAIQDDGSGNLAEVYSTNVLPESNTGLGVDPYDNRAAPIIDSHYPGNIIVCSGNNASNNIHVFIDTGSELYLNYETTLDSANSASIITTPSIGDSNMLYMISDRFYAFGNVASSTTTTTTTPTTTTTTTTPHTTTTTTTPTPTTTTTTTTFPSITITPPNPALEIVNNTQFILEDDVLVVGQTSSASDSLDTKASPFAKSFTFGTIAPGEISKTVIIQLNIPNVKAITNVKLGLVDIADITFTNTMFGINSSIELRSDITPDYYFQGVNTSKSATSPYNISIPNKDNYTSAYVYLNVKLPSDYTFKTGMLSYKWFFDYAD